MLLRLNFFFSCFFSGFEEKAINKKSNMKRMRCKFFQIDLEHHFSTNET